MKQKHLLLALPLLILMACSNEPTPPPPPTEKPIIFETTQIEWQTTYDAISNVYNTRCVDCLSNRDIVYRYAEGEDNPNKLRVVKFSIETAGNIQTIDISELSREASESPNGYFNVTLDGVILKYEKPGEFIVSYDDSADEEIAMAGVESRFYNISLAGDEIYETELRIEDLLIPMSGGLYPMSIDRSLIPYPTDRDYNEFTGAKKGFNYFVYLPADASEFPIVSSSINIYLKQFFKKIEDNKFEEISLDLIEANENFYVKINEYGKFSHREQCILNCEIAANHSGKERVFRLVLSPFEEDLGGPIQPVSLIIIQSAK